MNDQLEKIKEADEAKIDDPVAIAILDALSGGKTSAFQDVARTIAKGRKKPKDGPNLWRRYMNAVKQQAIHLAKTGRIEIMRKGELVDPKDFKGIVTMRLPLK